jgi:hypothetical protein
LADATNTRVRLIIQQPGRSELQRATSKEVAIMARKKAAIPRPKVAKLPTVIPNLPTDAGDLYNHCTASLAAFNANSKVWVNLYPSATVAGGYLATLGTALAAPPGPGATEAVNAAAEKVRQNWHLLAKYAQGIVRSGDIEDAGTLVASVLMALSNVGKRRPQPPLAAKPVGTPPTPGTVLLVAVRIPDALSYTFQWSLDGQTWSSVTWGKVRYTLAGLTSGKLYYFRVQAFLRNGTTTSFVGPVPLGVP